MKLEPSDPSDKDAAKEKTALLRKLRAKGPGPTSGASPDGDENNPLIKTDSGY